MNIFKETLGFILGTGTTDIGVEETVEQALIEIDENLKFENWLAWANENDKLEEIASVIK